MVNYINSNSFTDDKWNTKYNLETWDSLRVEKHKNG